MDLIIYGIAIISLIISFGAQAYIKSSYSKYSKVNTKKGKTGEEVARKILDLNGLKDVKVVEVSGYLSDHYDPSKKVVRLSSDNFKGSSVANVAVAAHECGHAIQDGTNYSFLRVRSSFVPVVNFSSFAGYIAILIGCITGLFGLILLGILCEVAILLFQMVTLPVEFDASNRALKQLQEHDMLDKSEISNSRTVLRAAALTYVASVVTTILYIIRLLAMFNRGRDRR